MKRFQKTTIALLTSIFIVAGFYSTAITDRAVPPAHADVVYCTNCSNAGQQAIQVAKETISAASDLISSAGITSLVTKEFALDGIVFTLVQRMTQQMTSNILQWINSGFAGSPAFVTNLEVELKDVADQTADTFIRNIQNQIDSQFGLDVRSALERQYYGDQNFSIQSTLSDAEEFFDGSDDGGWNDWLAVTQNAENTELGQYIRARDELNEEVSGAVSREIEQLRWGDGFKNVQDCQTIRTANGTEEQCLNVTMGNTIANQLSFELSIGGRTLIEADEINEIISALLAQLAQQAITGIGGILGLSEPGYSSGGDSYLDALANGVASSSNRFGSSIVEEAADTEREYRSAMETTVAVVDEVETTNNGYRSRYSGCYALNLPARLSTFRTEAEGNIIDSVESIAALTFIISELEQPDISPEREQELFGIFMENRANGVLHTQVDIAQADNDMRIIDDAVSSFEDQMSRRAQDCEERERDGRRRDGR